MSGEEPEELLQRLDPDRAAQAPAPPEPAPATPRARSSPRRYQWMAGLFGVALVIAFSVSQLSAHGPGTAGVPAGRPLPAFAAPLAGLEPGRRRQSASAVHRGRP